MRIGVNSDSNMLDAGVRDDKVLRKQSLLAFLGGRRMSIWFNQEASTVVIPQIGIRVILEATCNTPPPGRYICIQ